MMHGSVSGRGVRLALALAASLTLASIAHAQSTGRVAVAAHALERGHVLVADDIALVAPDALGTRAPLPAHRAPTLIGWTTKRVIAPGEALREPSVAPPNAIEAGQPVTVFWRDSGIEVRLKGVAANAAATGGRVTVRVDARRRLDGIAVSPGLVQIK
jgi:flagella basal body P-ring formation protein FlgA